MQKTHWYGVDLDLKSIGENLTLWEVVYVLLFNDI